LDGHNVCIFAYGQTGSGKTYSMEGPDDCDSETEGIIYRAMTYLLESSKKNPLWTHSFKARFFEIYIDQSYDLLSTDRHKIKTMLSNDNLVFTPELKCHEIKSIRDIAKVMSIASKNRTTAATDFNERSSRSHSVFQLLIEGENTDPEQGKQRVSSILNLIDLAGSESASISGESKGKGFEEARKINQSLTSLCKVINEVRVKSDHISFRDCELTKVLKPSFIKSSKIMMFVHLNPSIKQVGQTICSTKIAQDTSNTKVGKSKANKSRLNATLNKSKLSKTSM